MNYKWKKVLTNIYTLVPITCSIFYVGRLRLWLNRCISISVLYFCLICWLSYHLGFMFHTSFPNNFQFALWFLNWILLWHLYLFVVAYVEMVHAGWRKDFENVNLNYWMWQTRLLIRITNICFRYQLLVWQVLSQFFSFNDAM